MCKVLNLFFPKYMKIKYFILNQFQAYRKVGEREERTFTYPLLRDLIQISWIISVIS